MANEDYYGYLVTPESPVGLQSIRDWDAQRRAAMFGGAPARAVAVPQTFDAMSLVTPPDGLGIQRIHELDAMRKRDEATAAQAALKDLIGRTAAAGNGVRGVFGGPVVASPPGGTMITRNAPVREPVFVQDVQRPAPAVPAETPPATAPEMQGPQLPDNWVEPGIPIEPGGAVTSTDFPALPAQPAQAAAAAGPRRGFMLPVGDDMAPPSRRFGSTRPQFIYTNPAAAQQAAANYQAQLQYELGQDQGYRDYRARQEAERAATGRANLQAGVYRNQLEAQSRENALNRASNERITGMAESARAKMISERDRQEARNRYIAGRSAADQLNRDPNARVNRAFVTLDPATGRFIPAFPDPDAGLVPTPETPPPAVAVPQP